MKISRNKKCKRIMNFYEKYFGFFKPYNILIDGSFCNEVLKVSVVDSIVLVVTKLFKISSFLLVQNYTRDYL